MSTEPWRGRALHFVGIGGAGMSGLALVAHALGATVTGSDRAAGSPYAGPLRAAGIEPVGGPRRGQRPARAPSSSSPRRSRRRTRSGRSAASAASASCTAPQLLGELTRLRPTLAVTGTHGKTTTSSMLVHALRGCGMDPGYLVGGAVRSTGANAGWGAGEWLVVEADESDRSLLELQPAVAVLTNAELDHHTTYASQRDVDDTFRAFLGARAARRRHLGPPGPAGARARGPRGRAVRRRARADRGRLALHARRRRGRAVGPGRPQRPQRRRGAARRAGSPAPISRRPRPRCATSRAPAGASSGSAAPPRAPTWSTTTRTTRRRSPRRSRPPARSPPAA